MALADDVPEGYALIPIGQLTLRDAVTQPGREYWFDTLPPVLQNFPSITPSSYWDLTVLEHKKLVEWLEKLGVIDGGPNP